MFVMCENDMLWSGNLGLKMGVSRWHIPNMHMEVPPPPPHVHIREIGGNEKCVM